MDFDNLRKKMVSEQLLARDITDKKVLDVFLKIPRHKFILPQEQTIAYGDYPLSIECGQTISQPYIVALMTQCLKLSGSEKVLEIGTGSGYQTAVLAEMSKEVYTVERFKELSEKAQLVLSELGYKNIFFKISDGTLGWKEKSPFDAIIVTAGSPKVPKPLLDQLAEGGRLVIPVGEGLCQILTVFEKTGKDFKKTEICGCMFVPLIGKEAW